MNRQYSRTVPIILILLFALGCAKQQTGARLPEEASLAVAEFSQPIHPWQMLAGFPTIEGYNASDKVLRDLDLLLAELLSERLDRYQGRSLTRQCEEIILSEQEDSRVSALKYWVRVARCMPVDYLLVPHLHFWQERRGGDWSVESPAVLVFDLFLINAQRGELVGRFHFEERQQSLFENVLNAPEFFSRGGKWVQTEELARNGLEQGLQELGL
ncbi:MAG: hypothetical protein ACOC0U_05235 [Desulfovibrionales bacterium]